MSSEQRAGSRKTETVILGMQFLQPQELRRSLLSRKNRAWWIATMLALVVVGCSKSADTAKAPTDLTVRSVHVESAPKMDANGSDSVWKDAPVIQIPTKNGATVEMRSVYTDKDVYFLAEWPDETPQSGVLWWEYDGAKWRRNYETDDKISFLWNIDNSIPNFDTKGCQVVCHEGPKGPTMQILTKRNMDLKAEWPGVEWMADAWKWAPGVMDSKNTVDDGLFAAPFETRKRPDLADAAAISLVFDGGDQGTKQWFTRNPNAATAEEKARGIAKPAFMPRPGFDLVKNPFPNMRDMVQITDYSIFKAGDRIPMMVYFDLTNEKNKKDFPEGKPSGSRMDLSGKGKWKNGGYTLEFTRKLNTGHDDDVQFRPEDGKAVMKNVFGLAIFNDTRFGHTISEGVTLVFEP